MQKRPPLIAEAVLGQSARPESRRRSGGEAGTGGWHGSGGSVSGSHGCRQPPGCGEQPGCRWVPGPASLRQGGEAAGVRAQAEVRVLLAEPLGGRRGSRRRERGGKLNRSMEKMSAIPRFQQGARKKRFGICWICESRQLL